MAETSNEQLRDAFIRHQVDVLRLSGNINKRILMLLNAADEDVRKLILQRIEKLTLEGGVDPGLFTSIRFRNIQADIIALRRRLHKDVLDTWNAEFRALSKGEIGFAAATISGASPVILDLAIPDLRRIQSIVKTSPFRGRILQEWASNLARTDRERILGQIRIGLIEGDNAQQIARRVVGTFRLRGTDGTTQITRNQASAITRTATNHFATQARKELYKANKDILKEEIYLATLDSRTTPICRSLDGNIYSIGRGPYPPQHFQCRSIRVAYFGEEALVNRPFKSSTERQLLREFTRENNLKNVTKRANLPRGFKGKFDAFSRSRVRELTGTTPGTTTYTEFLRRQTTDVQNDILGATKGRLFREGDLTLDRFVDKRGSELTLRELAIKEKPAFEKAGLDPADFIS